MDENDVWLAGVFLDGVWAGTEGTDVWLDSQESGSYPNGQTDGLSSYT